MQLHPDCEPLAFLLGAWAGTGQGEYPTIEPFTYNEQVTFGHVGKPFLAYTQRTKHAETGQPLHAETGYLRALGGVAVEFVIAQPTGIVELHSGTVDGTTLNLSCDSVHLTDSAVSVTGTERAIALDGITLRYTVAMAAVGQPMTHHLRAELVRLND